MNPSAGFRCSGIGDAAWASRLRASLLRRLEAGLCFWLLRFFVAGGFWFSPLFSSLLFLLDLVQIDRLFSACLSSLPGGDVCILSDDGNELHEPPLLPLSRPAIPNPPQQNWPQPFPHLPSLLFCLHEYLFSFMFHTGFVLICAWRYLVYFVLMIFGASL
jgi:hypothetical protein